MDDGSEKCLETLATLLKQPHIEPATLERAMRSCIRYTQDHSAACRFANMGGISGLLDLQSSLAGVEAMAVMLIRHVYENKATLTLAMQSIMSPFSCEDLPVSSENLDAMLSSSAGRNRNLLVEIFKSSMQIKEEGDGMDFVGKVAFLKLDDMCQESKVTTTKLLDALPALVKESQSKKIVTTMSSVVDRPLATTTKRRELVARELPSSALSDRDARISEIEAL